MNKKILSLLVFVSLFWNNVCVASEKLVDEPEQFESFINKNSDETTTSELKKENNDESAKKEEKYRAWLTLQMEAHGEILSEQSFLD